MKWDKNYDDNGENIEVKVNLWQQTKYIWSQ